MQNFGLVHETETSATPSGVSVVLGTVHFEPLSSATEPALSVAAQKVGEVQEMSVRKPR